jgi:sugar/nucleoside kinase (ribokinase family)
MAQKQYDVLVAGEINPDLILTDPQLEPRFGQTEILVEDADLTPGSSSVIFACGASRLGLRVAFIGVAGDDIFGHFMLDALNSCGVDASQVIVDPDQKTGFTVILNRVSDRSMITHLGTINSLRADQVSDSLLAQARHIHVASYFLQTNLQPGLLDLFKRARNMELSTSLDTNWDPACKWEGVHDLLPVTNVFLPNENEASALMNTDDVEIAARGLSELSDVVSIKMGKNGALGICNDTIIRISALPVDVVDTVGAGDTFDAGFIYAFLKGWPLEKSMRLAAVCGSLSTQASGGTAAQPTLEEAMQYVSG